MMASKIAPVSHQPLSLDIQSVRDLPGACVEIAQVLENNPPFFGECEGRVYRAVSLETLDDAMIFDLLTANARRVLRVAHWQVSFFGLGTPSLFTETGKRIHQGARLWVDGYYGMGDPDTLRGGYRKVLEEMRAGWIRVNPKDLPVEQFPRVYDHDHEKFILFSKEYSSDRGFIEEDCLIRFLASKLSLHEDVKCYTEGTAVAIPPIVSTAGKVYLWVKRTAYERFMETVF